MDLGTRMKEYEYVTRTYLPRRIATVIRIDGKAFHTFTKGFKKPFDEILVNTMARTTQKLCANIQGCVFGYVQSDEISLLLLDNQRKETNAWFDKNLSKILSVSASMATLYFNQFLREEIDALSNNLFEDFCPAYTKALDKGALFDSRAFVLPDEEVVNYFIWRQQDAMKNSILSFAQSKMSFKELQGKKCYELQEILKERNTPWEDLPIHLQRGIACYKQNIVVGESIDIVSQEKKPLYRNRVLIDFLLPLFVENKNFIKEKK